MIKAEHKKWAMLVFNFYIKRLLRSNFNKFVLLNNIPNIPQNEGLVITPNHFSWWDGFFIDYIFKKLSDRKINIMMLEDQLKKYWFFRKVGAYSINETSPKSIIASMRYSNELISDPRNFVVIYPQGKIEPYGIRNITFKEGLKIILKDTKIKTNVLPVAIKISYCNEKQPDVYVRFGEVLDSNEVVSNYSSYKNSFVNNLCLLEHSLTSDINKDLFLL